MALSDDEGKRPRLETRLVHAGDAPAQFSGAKVVPIVRSTVFEHDDSAGYHDIKYPRLSTLPNHVEVARVMASIEAGEAGLVTSSGMSAITTTLLAILEGGGQLLAQRPLYGATYAFVSRDLERLGSRARFIDVDDPKSWESALTQETRAIYVESITNPLLNVADHQKVVDFAKRHELVSIIDNTFASPVNFRPLECGFDLVVHSATKYLNGHSDVCAGAVVGTAERIGTIKRWLDHLGGAADPEACYLLRRGLKTLALRVGQQNESALELARMLEAHARVERVGYPGLPSHPDHERAKRLFYGFGGMICCELVGGAAAAQRFVKRVRVATHSASLGGPETLVTIPARTSHAGLTPEQRARAGIGDGLIRISTGIEHVADLIEDFSQALDG